MQKTHYPAVAIIGLGVWGEKLVRVATQIGASVYGVDLNTSAAKRIQSIYKTITIYPSLDALLDNPAITAVIIATPPATHYQLTKAALKKGKHVLVEKPMTQNLTQATTLQSLAAQHKRTLMVDHTYLFSPALHTASNLIIKGTIGYLQRIESVRLGSRVLSDSSVLWDFASHDVAISWYLLKHVPRSVRTFAARRRQIPLDDAVIELNFLNNIRYVAHVSWTDPEKMRSLTMIGATGALVIRWDGPHETLTHYHHGQPQSIKTSHEEPLQAMVIHFFHCIQTHAPSLSDGNLGISVVRTITALHTSWRQNGADIPV